MTLSLITARMKDGIEYALYRDDLKPSRTYLVVEGEEPKLITIKEYQKLCQS